jgi:hypothetical protein
MATLEQEIINRLRTLDERGQRRVLAFLDTLEESLSTPLSLEVLKTLPFEERHQRVIEAMDASADEDFEIFEAYSAEDFDDYDTIQSRPPGLTRGHLMP